MWELTLSEVIPWEVLPVKIDITCHWKKTKKTWYLILSSYHAEISVLVWSMKLSKNRTCLDVCGHLGIPRFCKRGCLVGAIIGFWNPIAGFKLQCGSLYSHNAQIPLRKNEFSYSPPAICYFNWTWSSKSLFTEKKSYNLKIFFWH